MQTIHVSTSCAARVGGRWQLPALPHGLAPNGLVQHRRRCSRPPAQLIRLQQRPIASCQAGADSILELVQPLVQEVTSSAALPHPGLLTGTVLATIVFTFGWKVLRKGLSPLGVAHAWFLGCSIFAAFGFPGFLMVCFYFLFGTLVTKVKMEQKEKEGIAEKRSGERGPANVWGSGIAGVACAWAALLSGTFHPWQVGFLASFTSKLSDTVSSEIGKAYGQTTYLVTTFQRVPRGTEGAVSAEGTAAGVAAAVLYSAAGIGLGVVSWEGALAVASAAVVANLFESYLGAIVQGKVEWLSNDLVNMIQITLAALLAMGASHVFHIAPV